MEKEEVKTEPIPQGQDSIDAIENTDQETKELLKQLEGASNLATIVMLAWQIARIFAVKLVEDVLGKRAEQTTSWPCCPKCGTRLESKGKQDRQLT